MISKELFVTAFIADIHFGAQKSENLYQQLQDRFIKVIEKNKVDMIVFGGDLFHSIITMNYRTSHYVLLFIERVVETCKKNGIKYIRILQGTMSHDNNQLSNFNIYEGRIDIDFKIIRTVYEENLLEGIHILYVPEEYMVNQDEVYSHYLNRDKDYDFIFGHGMFKEVTFVARNQESEVTMSKAPVFDSKQFINACKGPIYFGHIHIRNSIKEHIHYPGSFSRWRFGEEDDKGWYLNIYNIKTHRYKHEFIKNTKAEKYVTISALVVPNLKPEDLTAAVNTVLHDAEHVKLKLIIKDDVDCAYTVSYLNNMYQNHPDVKLEVKNEFEFKREAQIDKVVNEAMEKYGFLTDESFTHEEKIQKFIKMKRGKDVPLDVINDILNLK